MNANETARRRPRRFFPARAGLLPLIYLMNLALPVYFLTLEPPGRMTAGYGLLVLFVWLYRELHWVEPSLKANAMLAAQLSIILGLANFYHPMYSYLGFMMSVPLSRQSPFVISVTGAVFLIGLIVAAEPYFDQVGLEFWFSLLPTLFGVCVLPWIIRASMKYMQMSERLHAATSQIERMAQQEERNRIARELHDTLGHTLSLIALKSELAEKLASRSPEQAAREAREIRDTARGALKRMRELVTEMKTVRLRDEIGHARTLCAAAGIGLKVHGLPETSAIREEAGPERTVPYTPLQESILAMCLREAITNVVRHSQANNCEIALEHDEHSVRLTIADDGIGLSGSVDPGNGLRGIRERLALVDGTLTLQPGDRRGTKLALSVPLVRRSLPDVPAAAILPQGGDSRSSES
ncbi:sensor histidine kinase [Paenibacillus thermoaerophilus]|uniref:histidine kinase n=1 Tax=Paenibacillus thermoaerophilus TaxID=1215385 RepID=A0ABW2V2P0_9BACL|nr:sensor histidine kinase [Paenibacillus thermoaerophilus]TMV14398.1 sensor histidine kinase [Paenibacillus thermoaerophilus]